MVGCSFCLDLTFTGPLHHCTSAEAREQELCHRREEKPGRGVKKGPDRARTALYHAYQQSQKPQRHAGKRC
jgi:hypothetical protein